MSEVIVKDYFGAPIHKGNIVAFTKGTMNGLDYGFVYDIEFTPKQCWLRTVRRLKNYAGSMHNYESKHLMSVEEKNSNIVVISTLSGEQVSSTMQDLIPALISDYGFPADYKLGQTIIEQISISVDESELEDESNDDSDLEILSKFGSPSNLK